MTTLYPYRQADGTIVWQESQSLNGTFSTIAAGAGAVVALAPVTGPAAPVVAAAAAMIAGIAGLLSLMDKADARKAIAQERGEFEKANSELTSQIFQLDQKIGEVTDLSDQIKGKLKDYGLAGLGFCLFNCAYNDEKKRYADAQATFNALQAEYKSKRKVLEEFITEFEQLRADLSKGVDYLKRKTLFNKILIGTLITAGIAGIGYGIYKYSTKGS